MKNGGDRIWVGSFVIWTREMPSLIHQQGDFSSDGLLLLGTLKKTSDILEILFCQNLSPTQCVNSARALSNSESTFYIGLRLYHRIFGKFPMGHLFQK